MCIMASQITSLTIVYSTVYSGAGQSKHQSSASLAFVRDIHRWPVHSPHHGPVTRKMFSFDNVIIFEILYLMHFIYALFAPSKYHNAFHWKMWIYREGNQICCIHGSMQMADGVLGATNCMHPDSWLFYKYSPCINSGFASQVLSDCRTILG